MNQLLPIVITSINQPTFAIKAFLKQKNFRLVIVADQKTPNSYQQKSLDFLTLSTQKKLYPELAKALPINSYCRKNLGYLFAWQNFATSWLFETDDDNLPLPTLGLPGFNKDTYTVVKTKAQFFNILALFTKQKAWLRGFPLNLLKENISYNLQKQLTNPLLVQSLINQDSDFDAVYRLTDGRPLQLKSKLQIALAKNVYGQVNSQATWWRCQTAPLMYFPVTIAWRTADIWRGYIAQRILWNFSGSLLYLSPQVRQKRLRHDPLTDFKAEIPLFTQSQDFVQALNSLELAGTASQQLYQVYKRLIKLKFFAKTELSILEIWLKQIKKLGL